MTRWYVETNYGNIYEVDSWSDIRVSPRCIILLSKIHFEWAKLQIGNKNSFIDFHHGKYYRPENTILNASWLRQIWQEDEEIH